VRVIITIRRYTLQAHMGNRARKPGEPSRRDVVLRAFGNDVHDVLPPVGPLQIYFPETLFGLNEKKAENRDAYLVDDLLKLLE